MPQTLPGFYIVRLGPRKADEDNLRGSFIRPDVDIRNFDIGGDYRNYYDKTVWEKNIPNEIVMDFGQPPRVTVQATGKDQKSTYNLKPEIGDILILVHGSRNPSGDGPNARRGLIGLAQVEDVYFYRDKQLTKPVPAENINQFIWAKTRCSLRAKVLTTAEHFLITPEEFKRSTYYKKSGLSEQETTLGIGSTSASGNISSLFSEDNPSENRKKVINLLALFKQFNPKVSEDLADTVLARYVPDEVTELKATIDLGAVDPKSKGSKIGMSDLRKTSKQKIYFGAPGAGKSRQVQIDTKGMTVFRTTFHPDTDYAGFVGAYKPALVNDGKGNNTITYSFVPQIFTKAYLQAWNDLDTPVCLIIEEINRGNCAQIFGDLFQLLDRDSSTGFSKYTLNADTDLASYLAVKLIGPKTYVGHTGGYDQLMLPPNLLIYATMNTSDQSLFPMDSAFKRRWDWQYIPIDYKDASTLHIQIGELRYNWGVFIEAINPLIYDLKGSEDKQLGNRFIDPADNVVSSDQFRAKVLFYLWNEVWRDEHESGNTIFQEKAASGELTQIKTFGDLFRGTPDEQISLLQRFMDANGIVPE
ncbi:McrB family protein [Spirosoma litoris]